MISREDGDKSASRALENEATLGEEGAILDMVWRLGELMRLGATGGSLLDIVVSALIPDHGLAFFVILLRCILGPGSSFSYYTCMLDYLVFIAVGGRHEPWSEDRALCLRLCKYSIRKERLDRRQSQ